MTRILQTSPPAEPTTVERRLDVYRALCSRDGNPALRRLVELLESEVEAGERETGAPAADRR